MSGLVHWAEDVDEDWASVLAELTRAFKAARSGWNILKAFWSLITTQDELVGNAVEDFIAKEWVSGANWIVRGDNNITTGVLKLEMVNP